MKVNGALASMFLRGELESVVLLVDIGRVTQEQPLKSGNGTSGSSSRGRGGGRSWRGVVEAAAEVRLMILAHLRLLIYPRRLEE